MVAMKVKRTSKYGIGILIHNIHMTDDVKQLNEWYKDVFDPVFYMGYPEPHYLPSEDRWASLLVVSDMCIETMAPNMPPDPTKPVGRFFLKHGRCFHSTGFQVDDLKGLGDHLIQQGVYIGAPGGGRLESLPEDMTYVYPHPKDTAGFMVELCKVHMPNDPRERDDWSELRKRWENHPLGITRTAWTTFGVTDIQRTKERLITLFEAVPLYDGEDRELKQEESYLQIGHSILQLARPIEQDTPLYRYIDKHRDMIYGVTFKVKDLDSVERYLMGKGIGVLQRTSDTVVVDPKDCYDAPYAFTTRLLPNDPLG
jgi:hypothetical protein